MMNKVISILSSIIFVGIINGDSFRLHLLFTNNIHGAIHEVPPGAAAGRAWAAGRRVGGAEARRRGEQGR